MEKAAIVVDKRSYQPIGLRDKNGKTLVIRICETIKIKGNEYTFNKPNIISLYLNKSISELSKAKQKLTNILLGKSKKDSEELTIQFYDYLECAMSSITNIYNAVESFTNTCIPNDYIYRKKNSKKIIEEFNKEQIERWCSLDEKLNQILPTIYNISKPSEKDFWEEFKKLEEYRNQIIHPKTYRKPIKLMAGDSIVKDDNSLYQNLFDESLTKTIDSGFKIIKYITDSTPENTEYPIFDNNSSVLFKQVDEFGDVLFLEE